MNHAKWSIDYLQKQSKANIEPRAKSITELVIEEKSKIKRETDTPEHVKRILKADEAQLNALT